MVIVDSQYIMSETNSAQFKNTLATLRQYMRNRKSVERCELCGLELPTEHQHLVEPDSRRIACSCDPCAILFSNTTDAKYKRIPRIARRLCDFELSDEMWNALMIPINMAFFFQCTPAERVVAMYPSPAGATESLLDFESWSDIVAANPILQTMRPDVEGLLVNRLGSTRGFVGNHYYLAPIDQCYKLVGLIRGYWRGLSGGTEVWQQIRDYFAELDERAQAITGVHAVAREVVDVRT
jgi:Family of unknown function (DUF5947)